MRALRGRGHKLKPVVTVRAAGFTDAVALELDRSLAHHELLKVRVNAGDRKRREALIEEICRRVGAVLVQRIGHVALLYRPHQDP